MVGRAVKQNHIILHIHVHSAAHSAISPRSVDEIVLLLSVDGAPRVVAVFLGSGFHFHEMKSAVSLGNNVDFKVVHCPVSLPHDEAFSYQKFVGKLFASCAKCIVLCHCILFCGKITKIN